MCLSKGSNLDKFPDKVCILGAGGAARSVAHACLMHEEVTELTVINRTFPKAVQLIKELGQYTGKRLIPLPAEEEHLRQAIPEAGLILNTTSVGMYPNIDSSPVPIPDVFHEGQVVCDIIYNPPETKFLKDAASQGAHTVCGLSMLAYQGACSLSLWTGLDVPVDVMLEVLRQNAENPGLCIETDYLLKDKLE
jgi:shikimate dehydrogenase